MSTKFNNSLFTFVLFLIIVAANILLTFLPLLNILSYESGAVNGIIIAFVGGLFWLKHKGQISIKDAAAFYVLLSVIPLIILFISTVFCQNCPVGDGLKFYLILTIPSIFVGLAIAVFARFISEKFKYLIFILIYFIVLLGFLPELYFNPQIYFYNPIFGYFPGVIYDLNIEITKELVYYRFINLMISAFVILFFSKTYNFKLITKIIVIIGVIVVYLNLSGLKSTFNFSTKLSTIKNELISEINTGQFKIIFPDSLSLREKQLLVFNHKFYYNDISKILNTGIDEKIVSIVFKSGAQKKRLFGAENADVTKPWLKHIYTDLDNYKHTLKHELAHIFSAEFARGFLKLPSNYNPGLLEGFAMAIENNFDDYNIHYIAALAYQNDYKISLQKLFDNFSFFSNVSSLSYVYAGSFIKYLAENYGWEKITELYSTTDFKRTFGVNISQLENSYFNSLKELHIPNNDHKANYYFGRKPLIKRYCARATAKDLKKSWRLYNEKNYKNLAEQFLEIYKYSGSFSALLGYSKTEEAVGSINDAIEILENEKSNFERTAYYYSIEYLLTGLYFKNDNDSLAFNYADSLILQNANTQLKINSYILKQLFEYDKELAEQYLNFPRSRLEIIESYLSKEYSEMFLQKLILLNIGKEIDYNAQLVKIKYLIGEREINSYSNFLLAKLAFENLDFSRTIRFCDKSLENADRFRADTVRDLKQKALWCLKNK